MAKNDLDIVKYINDPVYGGIPITQVELELIDTPAFQRLRGLRQLARVNYVFPGAEHSRYVHSLGVLYIMGLMTEHLLKKDMLNENDVLKMRVAALLHDIGHYPLSHLGEGAYSYFKENNIADSIIHNESDTQRVTPLYELASSHSKKAHHEHLGKYVVMNNVAIRNILEKYNLDPEEIGQIFTGEYGSRNMVYTQLLHSSLDADRLDYLLRDSYQTGVKYGLVDLQYLVRLLMVQSSDEEGNNKMLVCNKKGQHVVEHFLMSRYFHYSQVIFHKTNGAFEGLIKSLYIKLLQNKRFMYNSLEEIHKGVNSDEFINFNDSFLEIAMEKMYKETDDEEYKQLYKMYRHRVRPKIVFEKKGLYDDSPEPDFSVLKWELSKNPEKITEILKTDKWGYQIVPIEIEKIHSRYTLTESFSDHEEELREAVKLYDQDSEEISYLAEDKLSIINKLANFKSEFARIYILEEKDDNEYNRMHRELLDLITS